MADSTDQAMTQQLSWAPRILIGRTLQLLTGKFKRALGFGGQSPKERELLRQRDDLQGRVDSLQADKHEFASKITALDDDNKRLRELQDKEAQAHHDQMEIMQVQLNTGKAELEAAEARIRAMEMLTQDKDAAHRAHLESLEEQLKAARESLDSFNASAEEKNSAQCAEIDAKAKQVVDLQARVDEMQLRLDSKDDLLRSTLKDLKARPVDSDDERTRSIIAAIESSLPQMTYPTIAKPRLRDPVRKSYKHRMRQMQAARQRFLQDSNSTAFDTELDMGSNEATGSGQSATDDDDDDRILEYVLSSMKVALPQSVAGQTAEVFFELDDDHLFPDDKSDLGSPDEPHTEQHMQQQASNQTRKRVSRAVPPGAEEIKRQEFYAKWPRSIYSDQRLDENSIRLVEILAGSRDDPVEIRMAVHSLKHVSRQYEALSYVCGTMQHGHWITLNGEKVEIYPNLHNALTWLRQPTSTRRIWVDAICINQRSMNEKSKEIQRMGPIYNQAKTVNIFLGAPVPFEADSIGAFMKFLNRGLDSIAISRQGHKRYETMKNLCDTCEVNLQEVCQGFIKFCFQPWWRRVWTMQEFYLAAEEPLFYWGNDCCSTAALKRDFGVLETSLQDIYADVIARRRIVFDLERDLFLAKPVISAEVRRISRYISRCYRIDGFDIPRRLYSELSAEAFDPHDYIYGLRATFDPVFRKVFLPDYQMSPEMLFACLAVYLVVVEGWVDLLWWYPTRYRARDNVASWWPDFSSRSVPHQLDVKPLELDLTKEPQLRWTVENHLLHAEGYLLDKVYSERHIDKGDDGHKIISELWQFDHCMNWNHECNEYFDQVTEADNEWVRVFRDMHHDRYTELTHFNSSFRGALLQSTINAENRHKFPEQISQCVPCWDVLRWHALHIAPPGLPEALGQDARHNEPGYLEDIFSPRMRDTFREAFAEFFIGACIFDWGHLAVWLRRFPTASQWVASNHRYWASTSFSPSNQMRQRSDAIVNAYNSYTSEIHSEIMSNSWCYSFYYVFLAYVILLDCDDYESLATTIHRLQEAAEKLRQVYLSSTIPQIQDLTSQVPQLAFRLRYYETVLELFRGRDLLWTWGGFRGISCPGVETRWDEKSIVVILDGLSFPAVVNDFNEETGEGRLAGCVLLRGVDMLDRDTETAGLPPDYVRGEKRRFKLR